MASEFYGYRWAKQFGEAPSDSWVGLLDEVDGPMIARGLRKSKKLHPKWPPGAFEFIELCHPSAEDLGLLGFDDAFSQAVNWGNIPDREKNREVLAAIRLLDFYKFRQSKTEVALAMFRKAYDRVISDVKSGKTLPEVPIAIETTADFVDEAAKQAAHATGKATLEAIHTLLGKTP